jgi:hypothetical protein
VVVPDCVSTLPERQFDHDVQLFTFVVVLYVPKLHAAHVRSLVLEPCELTRCPAVQVVHVVQLDAFVVVL